MNWVLRNLLGATALIAMSPAYAADEVDLSSLTRYERNGKLDFKALERDYRRQQSAAATRPPSQPLKRVPHLGSALKRAVTPAADTPPPNLLSQPVVKSLAFVLRKDFSDIYLFTDPTPDQDAEGAEFSWTLNRAKNDRIWTANGMGALAYTYFVNSFSSALIGFSVAPYIQVAKEIHSNPQNDDTDAITFGGTGEIGFRNLLGMGPNTSDYFRLRVAATNDRITNSTITQVTGEWLPTWLSIARGIPGTPVAFNFLPELKLQYSSISDPLKMLPFSDQQRALRVGPEATLLLGIYDITLPEHLQFLRRISAKVTYHWWTEAYSSRTGSWLSTSVNYNLDEGGNLALSAGYKRGQNEETGAQTDLFKIALTGKMCAEISGGECASLRKKARDARPGAGG